MKDHSAGAVGFAGFMLGLFGGFLIAVIPHASVLVHQDKETKTLFVEHKDRLYKLVPINP